MDKLLPDDFPMGAIENGRVFIQHLKAQLTDVDYDNLLEVERCFEYMADYLNTRTPQAPDELLGALEWKPIETAPKGRETIIVWTGADICFAWYGQGKWYTAYANGAFHSSDKPTHWMPLPKPPREALSKYQKPKDKE